MLTINLFNGLVYGALLIVMCSGLALIYGLRRVVNFAHGSLYMLGAYLGYTITMHSNFWVALVAVPAIMGLLGVLLDRYGFRLLQDRDPLSVVLVLLIIIGLWWAVDRGQFENVEQEGERILRDN